MFLVEALALKKCFLFEMKHTHKTKSLKVRYAVTWWRTKLNKNDETKRLNGNNKIDTNNLLLLNLVWTIFEDRSVTICIEKRESFKQLKS